MAVKPYDVAIRFVDPPPPDPFPDALVRDVVQSLADREQFRKRSVRGWLRMLVLQIVGSALVLVTLLPGCSAPEDEDCTLKLDGYHCRCPDPAYTIADDAPWPCGHPRDGTCEPVTDCAADRTCHGLDGELVVIGADSLTVTTAGADGGVCTDTHAITRTR